MKAKKTDDVIKIIEEETTRTNKELLIAAGVCTVAGLIIGFIAGKLTTSRNTVKKYNKCYTYDFGDDEE
ncbi:MAG: hypothetical protein PUA49_00665 [Butyrivibrio sp.]|nr:hypothetical protein [Butyrivibrio sp.]